MNIRAESVRIACPLFHEGGSGETPTSALQLRLRETDMEWAQELNRLWHSVLPKTHLGNLVGNHRNVAFVAEFEDVAYGIAIWTTPIAANRLKDGWSQLELRRLAIAPDAPKNTASRMLGIMTKLIKRKFPDVVKLISYQAVKHHKGTIYKAAGWTAVKKSKSKTWHEGENRAKMQTDSEKIRWELTLNHERRS